MSERETCVGCGKPVATQEEWDVIKENEGDHLCWDDGLCLPDTDAMRADLARLRAERDADRKEMGDSIDSLLVRALSAESEREDLRTRLRLIAREVDGMGADDAVGCGCGLLNIETWSDLSIPVEPWALKMLDAKR